MKYYPKPPTDLGPLGKVATETPPADPPISEISIARLLDDGLLVLYREMRNLKLSSTNGKLGKDDARDLRDTVKLLFELHDREQDLLKGITDEDLNGPTEQNSETTGEE